MANEFHPVTKPSHYNRGKIQVLDFIEDQTLDYHLGNAVKYISRAGFKGGPETEIEDLEKAVFYLQRKIDILKEQREPLNNTLTMSEFAKAISNPEKVER